MSRRSFASIRKAGNGLAAVAVLTLLAAQTVSATGENYCQWGFKKSLYLNTKERLRCWIVISLLLLAGVSLARGSQACPPVPYFFRTYCVWADESLAADSALVMYNLIYDGQLMIEGRRSTLSYTLSTPYPFAQQPVSATNGTVRLAFAAGGKDCDYRYSISLTKDTLLVTKTVAVLGNCEKHMCDYSVDILVIGLPKGSYWVSGVTPHAVSVKVE
jgi:hypothetical protein